MKNKIECSDFNSEIHRKIEKFLSEENIDEEDFAKTLKFIRRKNCMEQQEEVLQKAETVMKERMKSFKWKLI